MWTSQGHVCSFVFPLKCFSCVRSLGPAAFSLELLTAGSWTFYLLPWFLLAVPQASKTCCFSPQQGLPQQYDFQTATLRVEREPWLWGLQCKDSCNERFSMALPGSFQLSSVCQAS